MVVGRTRKSSQGEVTLNEYDHIELFEYDAVRVYAASRCSPFFFGNIPFAGVGG